jgi:hypothetical protein
MPPAIVVHDTQQLGDPARVSSSVCASRIRSSTPSAARYPELFIVPSRDRQKSYTRLRLRPDISNRNASKSPEANRATRLSTGCGSSCMSMPMSASSFCAMTARRSNRVSSANTRHVKLKRIGTRRSAFGLSG